jgi:predicted N-acyltransferase
MADRESEIIAKIASGVSGLNARAWDRLAADDPFVSHPFLSALEDSRSVGPAPAGRRHRSWWRMTPRISSPQRLPI